MCVFQIRKSQQKAFSILELALVLTAMSFLIAVVFFGQKLKRGSEVAGLMAQHNKYLAAFESFYDRYDSHPGDFAAAYDYWPDDCGTTTFCNGDDDGRVEAYKESHLVWLHLQSSGLIEGSLTGSGDGDANTQTASVNVPKGSLYPVQLSLVYYEGTEFPARKHYMVMGAAKVSDIGYGAAFRMDDAYKIDEKFDDADPIKGMVLGRNGYKNGSYDNSSCLIDASGIHVSNAAEYGDANVYYNAETNELECLIVIEVVR